MKKLFLAAVSAALLSGCSGQSLDRQSYDGEWPFTVDRVTVGCDAMGFPYVEANRITYGLTGHAQQRGYPAVTPIHVTGKDIGPFIQAAIAQCK